MLRALLLLACDDLERMDIAETFLQGRRSDDGAPAVGFKNQRTAREVVAQLSALVALVRPQVIAFDQLDNLVAGLRSATDGTSTNVRGLELLAAGLMDLRDVTRRAVTLLSCLAATWELLRGTTPPFERRFDTISIREKLTVEQARTLVAAHLAPGLKAAGFTPPYETWPVAGSAFDLSAILKLNAGEILRKVKAHIDSCIDVGRFAELDSFELRPVPVPPGTEDPAGGSLPPPPPPERLRELDERFAAIAAAIRNPSASLDPTSEDQWMPRLLSAGMRALAEEVAPDGHRLQLEPDAAGAHAMLRLVLDEQNERYRVWVFRAIAHAAAAGVLPRLRNAATAAGLRDDDDTRALILIRNTDWPGAPGTQTHALLRELHAGRCRTLVMTEHDVRTFHALDRLLSEKPDYLQEWLRARKPASQTTFVRQVLQFAPLVPAPRPPGGTSTPPPEKPKAPSPAAVRIPVGQDGQGEVLSIALETLRKHAVLFAGSGSGKTVLIRRIVEEAALRGVSSIVLDTNNDLARLGDAWPSAPDGWSAGDAERAQDYLAHTDVVVWTPRRESGRPLSFQPLPDFGAVRDDRDALDLAIDNAVAVMAPRARVDGNNARSDLGRAVLKEALTRFAATTQQDFDSFLRLLGQFPANASPIQGADRIAASLGQALHAARVNDPLFAGGGAPVDPGVLLTPARRKRARVSVVSFIGLPHDEQRQWFVNQLQMALFAWVKRNPALDRPLGGLFVMDEAQQFAPSDGTTSCTHSTLALASQARKYGMGLIFATQAPKGLHNRISGNASTQFYGRLSAPIQIAAAKEIATSKGGRVDDIANLSTGEFYVSTEDVALQKVRSPMCLSHHPSSPLTEEQVLERARRA